jgi:methylase of polypeptide subunit release factors
LAVEIGRGQLEAVRRHAEAAGLDVAEAREDYSGIPRIVLLRRHSIESLEREPWKSSTS